MAERFLGLPSMTGHFSALFVISPVRKVLYSEFNYPDKQWPPGRKAYLVKLELKSFVDGRQDICKDKKI